MGYMKSPQVLTLAAKAHAGQYDRQGKAYIGHPIRVAGYAAKRATDLGLDPEIARQVGYLHDILEDTDLTAIDLFDLDIAPEVIAAVILLSCPEGVTYAEFIGLIIESENLYAIIGKLSDHDDNTDPRRSSGSNPGLAKRYAKSRARLEAALERLTSQ